MLRSRRLLGLPVIDLETGRVLGRVQRLLLDPRARRVAALVVGSGGWGRDEQVVLWEQARGVGPAAITVAAARVLQRASAVPELAPLLRRPVRAYGARVLTEEGTFLGSVEELVVDPATGQVVELVLATSGLAARFRPPMALSAACVLVMGEDAVVARAGSRPYALRSPRPGGDGRSQAGSHPPSAEAAGAPPGSAPASGAASTPPSGSSPAAAPADSHPAGNGSRPRLRSWAQAVVEASRRGLQQLPARLTGGRR
ncbi:MAG TPA: PRC-barrel domain-containing protein [Limnochordales bacterium]